MPRGTYTAFMCDIEHIKMRMKQLGLSQAELAARLHCGQSTLNRALTGKRRISPSLAARIKEFMAEQDDYITVKPPDDVMKQLRAWADRAHATIEQLVEQLIKELPRPHK